MGESVICDKGREDMTHNTQQEIDQLRALAVPYRFRVILNQDEEAVMPGKFGQIEWYSFNGKTLTAFTWKRRMLHKLLSLPWTVPHQVGAGEGSVTFPSERLGEIGILLKVKRRKKPEASSHLREFRFFPRHKGLETELEMAQAG